MPESHRNGSEAPSATSREPAAKSEVRERGRAVPESLRESFRTAADVAISRIMKRVASKEGMPTDAKTYRDEIVAVLKETDARLPEGHVLKGATGLLVENFLTPEEKGAELIRTMLEKGYSVAAEGKKFAAGPKEFDTGMSAIRSTLGFCIDLAKTRPEKIAEFAKEIRKVPEAEKLFARFPDMETLLVKILPEIAKNVDKQTFLRSFDEFAKEVRSPALSLLDGRETSDKERGDAALKLAHESAKLVSSSITKDTVKSGVGGLSDLSVVKNNPVAAKLVRLVKRPELSDEDRLSLVKKVNEGAILFTKNPPVEAELEKYANSAATLVSELSNKLPKDLVTDVMASLFRPEDGGKGKGIEIKSKTELVKLLFDNTGKLFEALKRYAQGELSTMKDVVRFIVEEKVLEENIGMAKGELVERLKKVVEIDLVAFSGALKAKLSAEMAKGASETKEIAAPAGLKDALSNRILSELASTFFSPNRPAKITKELLAEKTLKAAGEAIDAMPGATVRVGGADVPKTALKAAVTSPEFQSFCSDAFAKFAGEAGKGGATMERLAAMVSEIMKDPLGNRYVGDRTRQFAIDAFYALPASEIAETVSNNLESSGVAKYLRKPDGTVAFDKRDITEMVNVLRDGDILPREVLSKLLTKENLTPPVNAMKLAKELISSLSREQLSLLVEKVSARRPDGSASLLEKGLSIKREPSGKPASKEDVLAMVDLVFEASSKTDADTRRVLFERLGMDAKTAEYGLSFFRAFGKERVMRLAADHASTFAEIASGVMDPKKNPEQFIPLAVDIVYASDSAADARMVAETKAAFPQFAGLLDIEILGAKADTHLWKLKAAVPKERMRAFLETHSAELVSLSKNFDKALAAKIGSELLLSVDRDRLGTLVDASKLSGGERFAAEKLPQIRDALDAFRKETVTTPGGKTVSRLDALIYSGARAAEGKISKKEAEFLAGEAFELVSRLLPTIGEWKMPEGSDVPASSMEKKFRKEFLANNLGFVLGQALPYLFGRPTEKILAAYFADSGNKDAFVKTVSSTLAKA